MPQSLRKPQRLPENPTANVQVACRSDINAEQNKQRPSETAAFSVREGYLKPIPPLPRERTAGRKVCINPESYLKP